jgi:hypothetical protein
MPVLAFRWDGHSLRNFSLYFYDSNFNELICQIYFSHKWPVVMSLASSDGLKKLDKIWSAVEPSLENVGDLPRGPSMSASAMMHSLMRTLEVRPF